MSPLSRPIDYTNLGYESLREAMLELARENVPEWTDFSENDLGVMLVELFAYACDITLYYQTRIANNLFPATADEPDAVVQLLRLIGYELLPPAPAVASLQLFIHKDAALPVTIPRGAKFSVTLSGGDSLNFEVGREYKVVEADLSAPDAKNLRQLLYLVPVVHGITVGDEPEFASDGSPNQMFRLTQAGVTAGSIRLKVTDTSQYPASTTPWVEVETLAHSGPLDRHFVVQRDAAGAATVLFGDGVNGMIPPRSGPSLPTHVRVEYRVGGGARGNVPAGTQFRPDTLTFVHRAVNPQAAAGGADAEDLDRARALAPYLFRSQERAVTAQDFVAVALRVPGVAKARAVPLNWNQVGLYVAPEGQVSEPSELLKRDLLAAFESRRMVTTTLQILGPQPADIYLGATVQAKPYFMQSDVRAAVERAVSDYLALAAVDFGQQIYLSRIYDAIQSLDSVVAVDIFKFSRSYAPLPNILGAHDVATNGVIKLGPNELPRPGYRDNPQTPLNPAESDNRPPIFTVIEGGLPQ